MIRTSLTHRTLITLAVVLACSPLLANEGSRILRIRSKVECSSTMAKLADFVHNPELLTDDELALNILEAPKEDRGRRITLVGLAYLLQRYEQLHDLHLSGPRTIVVERTASPEHIEQAKSALIDYFKSHAPWKDWTIDLHLSSGDNRQIAAVGAFHSIKILTINNRSTLGNITCRLAFTDRKGNTIKQATVHPLVVRQVNAIVLRTAKQRGHVIDHHDVQLTQTWFGRGSKEAVTDLRRVIGRELSRNLSSGDILRPSDLMNPVGAKRGDVIWVTAKSGQLSIRLSVMALEGGRVGQLIRVRNQASKKIFAVELVGRKEAYVKL